MTEPPDLVGDEQASEQSAARLAAGKLPSQAEDRLGRMRRSGSYTSDLSTAEFAAVRSAGFRPVGQVLGTCVYQIGYTGTWQCGLWGSVGMGGYGPGLGRGAPGMFGGALGQGGIGFPGGLAGRGFPGGAGTGGFAGPLAMGPPGAGRGPGAAGGYSVLEPEKMPGSAVAVPMVRALREARRLATDRLRQECAEIGGDGVVGVRLTFGPYPGTNAVEFQAIGTAVRGEGERHPRQPFLSDLSGQDFAKLIHAGWVPCGLAVGIAVVVRHDDWATRSATSFANVGNIEVPGYTALVQETRKAARHSLEEEVHAVGGDGVVVGEMTMSIGEHECAAVEGGRDHMAEAVVIGTSVARFQSRAPRPAGRTLAVLRLGGRGEARRSGTLTTRPRNAAR